MADTNATVGYQTRIENSATLAGTYVAVAQTRDIKGPGMSRGSIDVTNNDSVNNQREKHPGLIDNGQVDFDCVYTKTQCAAIYTIFKGPASYWKVTYPDLSVWAFKGFISDFGTETETDDKEISNTITIEVDGGALQPTFTPGT